MTNGSFGPASTISHFQELSFAIGVCLSEPMAQSVTYKVQQYGLLLYRYLRQVKIALANTPPSLVSSKVKLSFARVMPV